MKRLTLTLLGALCLAAPLASAGDATARDDRGRWEDRQDRGRRGPPPWSQGRGARAPYDEPPAYGRGPAVRRGGVLPPAYRNAPIEDYGRYRLRPPPRGYDWYRYGDSYLMVSPRDGRIFDMIE